MATGAVMPGRRTFEVTGRWGGDHHDGVPTTLTRHTEDGDVPPGNTTFHTDIASWAAAARGRSPRDGPRRRCRPGLHRGWRAARDGTPSRAGAARRRPDPYSRTALCIRWNWNWSDDWTDTTSLIFDTAFDSDFPADVPQHPLGDNSVEAGTGWRLDRPILRRNTHLTSVVRRGSTPAVPQAE